MKGVRREGIAMVVTALLAVTPLRAAVLPPPASRDARALLEQADAQKAVDVPAFTRTMADLAPMEAGMDAPQLAMLHYLRGWRATWVGDYVTGKRELLPAADQTVDMHVRLRATSTLVNLLGMSRHYEEAFHRLADLQDMLPTAQNAMDRFGALGEASQLLSGAGQFEQAEAYAQQMIDQPPPGESQCKGMAYLLRARRRSNAMTSMDPMYLRAIDTCTAPNELVYANTMRVDVAAFDIAHDRAAEAVKQLTGIRASTVGLDYPVLLSELDATLAWGWFTLGDLDRARESGLAALGGPLGAELTEPRRMALEILFNVAERTGHAAEALAYHVQYMAADKAWLTDLSARSLAFQIVNQQLMARKAEVRSLSRQNEILRLTNALDRKQVETGRLYISLLAVGLFGVIWLVLRLRRSQLRFMRLARRDSLTGISNREHFDDQAARILAYGARSERGACLIVFDLDHFKTVNDTHGHAAGDAVLRRVVEVCRRALHACDAFGRLGGEEFAILLPDSTPAQARARAEQLRLSIAAAAPLPGKPTLTVTASFGIASTIQCGFELQRMVVVADAALYRAKRAGRNCVFMGDTGDIPDSPYVMEARS